MSIVSQLFRRPILSRPRTLLSVENDLLILSDTLHRLSNSYSNILYLGNVDAAEELLSLQQSLVDITSQLQATIEYYQQVSNFMVPGPGEDPERLGIRTLDPQYTLDVAGDVGIVGPLYVSGTLLVDPSRAVSNVTQLSIGNVLVLDGDRNLSNVRTLEAETLSADTGIFVELAAARVLANVVTGDLVETNNLNVAYITQTANLLANTATIANLLSETISVSELSADYLVGGEANISNMSANTLTVNVLTVQELHLADGGGPIINLETMLDFTANSVTVAGNTAIGGNLLVQRYLLQPDGSQKKVVYYFGIDENETLTLVKQTEGVESERTVATFFDETSLIQPST